jgi:multimeric flavodoxin WrbA
VTATRVFALNGSPKGPNGNTEILLQEFLAGVKEAGGEASTAYVKDLHVEFCRGCFSCWVVTPGKCVHDDDVPRILDEIRQADVLVWATPLYHSGMTAMMKALLERTLPLSKPWMVQIGGRTHHPGREGARKQRTVLISNCGFPERENFAALEAHMAQVTHGEDGLAGTILCAAGPWLGGAPRDVVQWYLNATRQAGREVVETGRISDETNAILARPLATPEMYVKIINQLWKVPGDAPPTLDEAMGRK